MSFSLSISFLSVYKETAQQFLVCVSILIIISTYRARLEIPVMICTSLSFSIAHSIFISIFSISLLSTTFHWATFDGSRAVPTCTDPVLKCPLKRVPRLGTVLRCTQLAVPIVQLNTLLYTVSLRSYISSCTVEPSITIRTSSSFFQMSKGGPPFTKQLTNVDHLQQQLNLIDW